VAWSFKPWASEVDALLETPGLQTLTSRNVDANRNSLKKLLLLGSDAFFVSFEKLLSDFLYKK
jgi:hypothetical protein